MKSINTLGWAGGAAANDVNTALGSWYWYYHPELFASKNILLKWQDIISYHTPCKGLSVLEPLTQALEKFQVSVAQHLSDTHPLLLLGGDHSIAMGSWPAIKKHYPSLGLIWVDAHLDSHTPDTSLSKNLHGMPLSRLLGLWGGGSVFKPQQICVIGVRSYESAEYQLLQSLGVKVIMMQDVEAQGIQYHLRRAIDDLSGHCAHLGISIDLDAFDPADCPGVGYREPQGIAANDFFDFFKNDANQSWVAIEIAEFNPMRDIDEKTAKWLPEFLSSLKIP